MKKTTEQNLRERFFNLIQNNGAVVDMIQSISAEGVWFWETDSPRQVWINQKFWQTLGFPMYHQKEWRDVIHVDDIPKINTLLTLQREDPRLSFFETIRFNGNKGNVFHFRFRVMLVKEELQTSVICTVADVTDLLHNQEIQRRSNEIGKIGFWEVDLVKGTNPMWSPMTRLIHEVPTDYNPNFETAIEFYKEGEHRERIYNLFKRAVDKEVPFDDEFIIITDNGKEKWVRSIGTPEFVGGKCVRIYGTFQDIQEKKEQTKLLESQKNFLDDIIENLQEGFILLDSEGNITRVNESFQEITGYSEKELLGDTFPYRFIYHGRDVDFKAFSKEIYQSQDKPNFTTEFLQKNGDLIPVRVSPSVLLDSNNRISGLYATVKDISQELKDKQKIQDSLSKLQSISSATTQISIIGTDNLGKITSFNTGAEKLLSYTVEEVLGEDILSLHLVSKAGTQDEAKNRLTQFSDLTQRDASGEFITREWSYVRKNGSVFPVQLSVSPVKDELGNQTGLLFMGSDISKIKRVKQEIRALLGVTKDQNERLLNFAHIVSHNLRSHSSNFRMILDLMTLDFPEVLENDLFEKLMQTSDNLKETIAHLNEVVVMNTSTEENLKKLSVLKSCQLAFKNVEGFAKENEVTLKIEVKHDIEVEGIAAYLDSVILNLISNGIKYSSRSRKSFVTVKARESKGKVEISVIDNGVGIDLARHGSKVFGMYKTFHGNSESRGVGLFITKNQVEAMGGRIDVTSQPNKGSTFKVQLNG